MYQTTPGYMKVWKWLSDGEVAKTVTNLWRLERSETVASIIIEYQAPTALTAASWNVLYQDIVLSGATCLASGVAALFALTVF